MYEPRFIKPTYKQISLTENDDDDDDDYDDYDDDDDRDAIELIQMSLKFNEESFDDEPEDVAGGTSKLPLEWLEEQLLWNVWNRWEEPCILSILITAILVVPTLVLCMYGAYQFSGRLWGIWVFVLHLQFRLATATWYIKSMAHVNFKRRTSLRITCSIMTLIELLLFGFVYPEIANAVISFFFNDMDGTIVYEWIRAERFLKLVKSLGWIVVILRCFAGVPAIVVRTMKYLSPTKNRE
jgi:hypothetical protein